MLEKFDVFLFRYRLFIKRYRLARILDPPLVELPVDYVHTQIAFVKTIIEHLRLIAKPLIMRAKVYV
ncbi:hypothetical protein HanIR_Chr02g0053391 [Helianthus annuus]|nr:hypothetical protein HanIR_Chr02g0053391 [Helianthus annuus]